MPRSTGIRIRHARSCRSRGDGSCKCAKSYEAWVWSARDSRKIYKRFPTEAAARQWRADAQSALSRGGLRAPTPITLRDAAAGFMAGARDGSIRNRNGGRFKPSTIRGYDDALERRILPPLGGQKLTAITSADIQALVDRLLAERLAGSTIRNAIKPLQAIYRRACRPGGEVAVNPTIGLHLPAANGRRERIATAEEAERLLAALNERDRPLWATAFYAGLRVGELLALRDEHLDLASGVIRVERAYDPVAREFIDTKSRAGTRKVPIVAVLRDYLDEHLLKTPPGLVFGSAPDRPFDSGAAHRRARRAWARVDAVPCAALNRNGSPCNGTPKRGNRHCAKHRQLETAADTRASTKPTLEPIGFHEARHTFASLMIDAGVNVKAISTFMGHSSVAITIDRYGHLMPGGEEEAASRIDAYLERANTHARLAQVKDRAPLEPRSAPVPSGFLRTTAENSPDGA